MINILNIDGNIQLEFDFLANFQNDFDITKGDFEKWIPFVLQLSTSQRTIAITEEMQAYMTIFEVKKIYNGLKNLLRSTGNEKDRLFTHYSSESFFEVSFEYLLEDECVEVELWFIVAEYPEGRIVGYDAGFRFIVGKSEMKNFVKEFYNSFKKIYPQCSL